MSRDHSHTLCVARIIETRERLREVLDKDRKELADYQEARNDTAENDVSDEVPSSERFARNMALIRMFESEAASGREQLAPGASDTLPSSPN
jgi:hypothetical protein